jgi:hypothetical protein
VHQNAGHGQMRPLHPAHRPFHTRKSNPQHKAGDGRM